LPLAEPAAGTGKRQARGKPEERAEPALRRLRKRLVRKADGRSLILYEREAQPPP
jgi:hypothetical protein